MAGLKKKLIQHWQLYVFPFIGSVSERKYDGIKGGSEDCYCAVFDPTASLLPKAFS